MTFLELKPKKAKLFRNDLGDSHGEGFVIFFFDVNLSICGFAD
tara:strand:+ start:28920 stop:29048 length:129 start_codon:yes stop_codon:yes gene_type:complete